MLDIVNQIPSFDTLRKNVQSRYYVVDSNFKGKMRFAYGVANDEAVFKDGTSVKSTAYSPAGSNKIYISNPLIGIARYSYVKIGEKFYLVNFVEGNEINIYNTLVKDIDIGTEVRLFSTFIETDTDGFCSEVAIYGPTTIIFNDNKIISVDSNTSVDDVYKELSKETLVRKYGNTLWVIGRIYSSNSYYKVYEKYPYESGFINIKSQNFIVPGDDLVLFNEDIRGNTTLTVESLFEKHSYSGYSYTAAIKGASGNFSYAQLRAYPAYISDKIDVRNLKPSIVDLCHSTVYGTDIEVLKGIKLFNNKKELTNGFEDLKYVLNFDLEPCDLMLEEILNGTINVNIPNLDLIADENGIFRMYIDSKVGDTFRLSFLNSYEDTKISIVDVEGNILKTAKTGDIIEVPLNKVTLNIKTIPNLKTTFNYFKSGKELCTHLQYYFVCQEHSNERVEVNGLHLNPIFKNFRELLAKIGEHQVNEGRIAL